MTRPTIDTNILNQAATTGRAQCITDPANTFFSSLITNVNNLNADLDTASIPSTTGATETKTSGTLSTTIPTHLLSVTGAVAFTLPDGLVVGQTAIIECTVAAISPAGTLTITTPLGSELAVHVFTAVGQRLELVWLTGGWHHTRKVRCGRQAVVVGTDVLTGYNMCSVYDLSVTGTVHSTGTKGIPNGSVPGEKIYIDVLTAAISATGDIDITAKTTVGVAATNWGSTGTSIGSGGTTKTATLAAEWDGTAWQTLIVTTATLA